MNFYLDVSFFILLTIYLVLMFLINYFNVNKKRIILLVLSMIFLTCVLGPYYGLFVTLTYLSYEYIVINVAFELRRRHGRNYKQYPLVIIFSLLPLIFFKLKPILNLNFVHIFAVSFLSLKNIEIISENNKGILIEVLPIDYLNYMLFFPTFIAGPVDNIRRFIPDTYSNKSREIYLSICGTGFYRLITGIFYKFFISNIFFSILNGTTKLNLLESSVLSMLYIYFEVSGYANMAIGTSYIAGIRTPEEFNKGLLSNSFIDFWDNYMITIASWFKIHIYDSLKNFIKKSDRSNNIFLTNSVSILITFVVFGLWHGFNLRYIFFAIYNAFFYIINYYIKTKTDIFDEVKESPLFLITSYIITFILLSFGFLIFSGRLI